MVGRVCFSNINVAMSYFIDSIYYGDFSICLGGRWSCTRHQKPSTCAVGEGSHVTTFDGKTYTFHGDCYYTLAKVESKVNKLLLEDLFL